VWTYGYDHEHRYSTIKFVTPAQRHAGLDSQSLRKRKALYETAKTKHPERWSGPTRNWDRTNEVWLNPSKELCAEQMRRVKREQKRLRTFLGRVIRDIDRKVALQAEAGWMWDGISVGLKSGFNDSQ
jgi:hypothetical protein